MVDVTLEAFNIMVDTTVAVYSEAEVIDLYVNPDGRLPLLDQYVIWGAYRRRKFPDTPQDYAYSMYVNHVKRSRCG